MENSSYPNENGGNAFKDFGQIVSQNQYNSNHDLKQSAKTARVIVDQTANDNQRANFSKDADYVFHCNSSGTNMNNTKELKSSLITGSRFNQMVKENLKKTSDVSSTNNTTIKQSIDKRALTSRVVTKKSNTKEAPGKEILYPNDKFNFAAARKSMNMIYEKPTVAHNKKNSRFNSIGHAAQIQISTSAKKTEFKKPIRTERNKTQINFTDLLPFPPKHNSLSSTRLSGIYQNQKSLKQSISPPPTS